ncbi:MAG: hypothetical protein HY824_15145 [Acidobacteria bacterium]|nr:hypothetical protein [Acidobacteriota bacterium]
MLLARQAIEAAMQNIYRSLTWRLTEGFSSLVRAGDAPFADIDDPIERMSARYARLANAYLLSRPDYPFDMGRQASSPTPAESFARYHRAVPAGVHLALVTARAGSGDPGCRDAALAAAKAALAGMDGSLDALARMAAEDRDPRLDLLQAQLRWLRRELEARFSRT